MTARMNAQVAVARFRTMRLALRQQMRFTLELQERYDRLAAFSEQQARDLDRAMTIIADLKRERTAA